jgi:hypothetical protein
MNSVRIPLAALTAVLLVARVLPASESTETAVDFSTRVQSQLLQQYGTAEGDTLREAIRQAVAHATARLALPPGAVVSVRLEEVAPTRPTRKQQTDDPGIDPIRSKYVGGAELSGSIRDASDKVLASASYHHYAWSLPLGSAARDPWADARLAIEGFADRLAAAYRKQGAARG